MLPKTAPDNTSTEQLNFYFGGAVQFCFETQASGHFAMGRVCLLWRVVLWATLVLEPATSTPDAETERDLEIHHNSETGDAHNSIAVGSAPHINGKTTGLVPPGVEYVANGAGPEKNTTKESDWNIEKQEKPLEGSREVMETQHATCQVTTEELVATAQATVTRVMRGLCNAREMDKRFQSLEALIEAEVNGLKTMIMNIEDRLADHNEMVLQGQKQVLANIARSCEGVSEGDAGLPRMTQQSRQLEPNDGLTEQEAPGTREPEILKFNSSIHLEPSMNGSPKKVFTYYWKVRHMQYKLTGWNPRRSLRSQSFYIFPNGYRMYLKVYPRQNGENFNIHVGVTKGEFDDTLPWPFPLKHRVHILDQTKEGRTYEDIASRVWDPTLLCSEFNWQKPTKGDNYECVGLGFPHDVLRQRDYIWGDAAIIKLTVYLE